MTTVTIPLGATVRVKRQNGSIDAYIFRGTDADGPIFVDAGGKVHRDLGMYVGIAINWPDKP